MLPGRKADSGIGVLWGPLAWITQHSEPRRANKGMSHWKAMSERLHLWKRQHVPTRIQAGQRGEEQPREERGLASQTVENIPEHLSCLEVFSVLLIACSYQLLLKFSTHTPSLQLAVPLLHWHRKEGDCWQKKSQGLRPVQHRKNILYQTDLCTAGTVFPFYY